MSDNSNQDKVEEYLNKYKKEKPEENQDTKAIGGIILDSIIKVIAITIMITATEPIYRVIAAIIAIILFSIGTIIEINATNSE